MKEVEQDVERSVEGGGYAASTQFTMMATAKMFKITITGLYADKPLAIVRELGSNAYDAHSMAGTPERPFELHLPTRFAPHFSIRDFGPGMSHEFAMQNYTSVGFSTKEDDNTSVGKFGLGAKTPFAYTDQFMVTSRHQGMKRTYNAFMDADGIPNFALFHEEATTEESGLEVSFAVQPSDAGAFLTAAKRVLIGFDVPPTLTGAPIDLERELGTVVLQGNGWALRTGHDYGANRAYVRQGCVVYPLDANALHAALDGDSGLLDLINSALVFDVPIGSVDITPSRESLSYGPQTITNIVERLKVIAKEITHPFLGAVHDTMRLREVHTALTSVKAKVSDTIPIRLQNTILNALRWRGKAVNRLFGPMDVDLRKNRVPLITVSGRRRSRYTASGVPMRWDDTLTQESMRWSWVDSTQHVHIILSDPNEGSVSYTAARIRKYIESNAGSFWWVKGTAGTLARLQVLLNRPGPFASVVRLVDLPKPEAKPRTPVVRGPKGTIMAREMIEGALTETRMDPTEGGVYVLQNRGEFSAIGVPTWCQTEVAQAVRHLQTLNVLDDEAPVYVVPMRHKDKIVAQQGKWKSVQELAKETATATWSAADALAEKIEEVRTERLSEHGELANFIRLAGTEQGVAFAPHGAAYAYVQATNGMGAARATLTDDKVAAKALANLSGVRHSIDATLLVKARKARRQPADDAFKALEEAYPLIFKAFRYSFYAEVKPLILDFIRLKDADALVQMAEAAADYEIALLDYEVADLGATYEGDRVMYITSESSVRLDGTASVTFAEAA